MKLHGRTVVLKILDPSTDYDQRMNVMYTKMMGAIFIYSINNRGSFDNIAKWFEHFTAQNVCNAEKILLGTNFRNHGGYEPRREVSKERGQQLASSLGISFRELNSEDDIDDVNEFVSVVNSFCSYLKP